MHSHSRVRGVLQSISHRPPAVHDQKAAVQARLLRTARLSDLPSHHRLHDESQFMPRPFHLLLRLQRIQEEGTQTAQTASQHVLLKRGQDLS